MPAVCVDGFAHVADNASAWPSASPLGPKVRVVPSTILYADTLIRSVFAACETRM